MNTDSVPTEPQLAPSEPVETTTQPTTPTKQSTLRKIFLGPNGIRAGWRLLLFLLLMAAFQYVLRLLHSPNSGHSASLVRPKLLRYS
jgi:hypothetical protein